MAVLIRRGLDRQNRGQSTNTWLYSAIAFVIVLSGISQSVLTSNVHSYLPSIDDLSNQIFQVSFFEPTVSDSVGRQNLSTTGKDARTSSNDTILNMLEAIPIRRWGCGRNESPLIFVHIGKAGGGMVRARFAASAQNYQRNRWYAPMDDQHYYPVTEHYNGSFCNSGHKSARIQNSQLWPRTYEGITWCNATSPIGGALACPEPRPMSNRCLGCHDFSQAHCHQVYVGHNNIGSEFYWLPPAFLKNWWTQTEWASAYPIDWNRIHEEQGWCKGAKRAEKPFYYNKVFATCSVPIGNQADADFNKFWNSSRANREGFLASGDEDASPSSSSVSLLNYSLNYSPLYASLPLHRVTVVREPYSWLVSKFFWGRYKDIRCDDIAAASRASFENPGWAYLAVVFYLMYLCGDDCAIRLEKEQISYEEIRVQVISNLKQAFSVVGLLNETDTFFDMVSARIAYVDMSLNQHVMGERHATSFNDPEKVRCKEVFSNTTFQEALKAELPMLAIVEEAYQVALQVNRDQLAELKGCPGFGQSKAPADTI